MGKNRMAGKRKEFEKFLEDYDRKAYGAGSEKDPPTDRFSGLDVRRVFDEGRGMGLSKAAAAEEVLDYASDIFGLTKAGTKASAALDKLRGFLDESVNNIPGRPDRPDGQFGDPTRTDPGTFASSYFDYLGTGDPSDPRQYYMYGVDGPVGIARADRPVRTDRFGVPEGMSSFLADGPLPSTYETESEFQERNRPDFGDIFGGAARGAGGAFLDSVLADILQGIRDRVPYE
jgi:hypothetical protein